MKLQGEISRCDLVKYLAKEYAHCQRMIQYLGDHKSASLYRASGGAIVRIIWDIRDNAI